MLRDLVMVFETLPAESGVGSTLRCLQEGEGLHSKGAISSAGLILRWSGVAVGSARHGVLNMGKDNSSNPAHTTSVL